MAQETDDGKSTNRPVDDVEHAENLRAAGGLVWRRQGAKDSDAELILVHRRRYDGDWTLPKGKLHPGETWQEAALREVREETGCEVELGPFAGTISYPVNDIIKVVHFWHMRCLAADLYPRDDEVVTVAWLPPDQAQQRMTYESEHALLSNALASGLAYVKEWR